MTYRTPPVAADHDPAGSGIAGPLRVLAGPDGPDPEWLTGHLARLGPPPHQLLIDQVRAAGLRGRGGAGFPAGQKMAAVRAKSQSGGASVVVGNGVESEPASAKDRVLLCRRPHLVLDGLQLAGSLVHADRLIVALGRDGQAIRVLREALIERRTRMLGEISVELVTTPGGFVAGEETALTSWVAGAAPNPRPVPPRPFERGVGGRPTLVHNVETLAHLALIARFGAEWFRTRGLEDDPGSCLVTVSGEVDRPGVYEVAIGTPMTSLLRGAGWDDSSRGLLVGGYFGTWIAPDAAAQMRFCRSDLEQLGAAPGSGVIVVLAPTLCGVREGARVLRWLAGESSGQCGPCLRGLPAIAGVLERLADPSSAAEASVSQLLRWCDDVQGRGACHHPDGAVRLARSVVRTFASEVASHQAGRCTVERPQTAVAAQ
ncbi:MAG: NADH-ubiquinone oxidoreductase-F iron-sulfur binding region domain-containing protein [Candidatus Dormiibacterota bacterium]